MGKIYGNKLHKGEGFVYLAISFLVLAYRNIGDPEPVAHLFGLLGFFGAIIFIVCYLWHEIARVYPADKVRKKRLHAILSALSGIAFAPLMAILMIWQFYPLLKEKAQSEGKGFWEMAKDHHTQFYFISILCILVGTSIFSYRAIAGALTSLPS